LTATVGRIHLPPEQAKSTFNSPYKNWYKKNGSVLSPSPQQTKEGHNVNEIIAAVAKAVLVTLISTIAAITVEKIRRYNEDRNEDGYYHPGFDEYDRY